MAKRVIREKKVEQDLMVNEVLEPLLENLFLNLDQRLVILRSFKYGPP